MHSIAFYEHSKNLTRNPHFIIFLNSTDQRNHVSKKVNDLNQSIKAYTIAIRSVRTIKISIEE